MGTTGILECKLKLLSVALIGNPNLQYRYVVLVRIQAPRVAPIEDQAPSDEADQNISSNSTDDVANAYTLNILACLDVATGATDIQSGTNTQRAEIADLKCPT